MARKFKIGDTVEVIRHVVKKEYDEPIFRVGVQGKIIDYEHIQAYPYRVKKRDGTTEWFCAQELKLVKKASQA